MVSPAKISEETEIIITNNIPEEASYTVESECAEISETIFNLGPTEKKKIIVKPKCKGHITVSEETETAINRFNLPVQYRNTVIKEKSSLLIPLIVFIIVAVVLIVIGRKLIKSKI
ncbi:MAG: hypothetical protein V1914_04095 [archaeon]